MRIIAGVYRGRILKTLRGLRVRPTGERLRASLFDVLGESVQGAVFVDCYAGAGAVGLEAVSRGAQRVFLIEADAAAHRLLRENWAALGEPANVHLLHALARDGLRRLEKQGVEADFCFLDPPYATLREREQTLRWLSTGTLIAPGGMIILQHSRKDAPEESLGVWKRVRLLVQGSNALSFYRRPDGTGFIQVSLNGS